MLCLHELLSFTERCYLPVIILPIFTAETIVKLGLNDIANSLRTGAVVDKAGEMAGDVVGGLIGQLQNQLQGRFGICHV